MALIRQISTIGYSLLPNKKKILKIFYFHVWGYSPIWLNVLHVDNHPVWLTFKFFFAIDSFFFLDSDFSLVALFKLVLKIFRQVLKTCSHLMLNLSWDVSQWSNIRKLEKTSLAWLLHHKIEEKNPAPIYPAVISLLSPKLPDNEGLQTLS